jgi:hypothetical protein
MPWVMGAFWESLGSAMGFSTVMNMGESLVHVWYSGAFTNLLYPCVIIILTAFSHACPRLSPLTISGWYGTFS